MKRRRFNRVLFLLLLTSLALWSASCRGGKNEPVTVTSDTLPVTETVTDTSAVSSVSETTVTEPIVAEPIVTEPISEKTDAQTLCEVLNRQVELLFAQENEEKVDAEEMLDVMLPYLMGGNEDFSLGESYRMHHVTVTGEGIDLPDEVISHGGVTVLMDEDPEYGPYREIEVARESGTVYLSTYGGVTTVDEISMASEDSLMGDLDADAMRLKTEYLTEETGDGVWTVSPIYVRQVLRALIGREAEQSLKNKDMSCTLTATDFEEKGALTMTLTLSEPAQIGITLDFSGIGQSRESMTMALSAGEDNEIRLSCGLLDGVPQQMSMHVRQGESVTEVEQTVNGTHTDLTMLVKVGDTVNLSCKLSLDMVSESEARGTVDITFLAGEQSDDGFIQLSNTSATESVARGEFTIRLEQKQIASMEMMITAQAGTVLTETNMRMIHTGAAVGDAVMRYDMHISDIVDPTLNSTMEMEIRLTARNGDAMQYEMSISAGNGDKTAGATAEIQTPSEVSVSYTEQEKQLIGRAERFLENHEDYAAEAQEVVDTMIGSVTPDRIVYFPSTFYMEDRDGDGIVVLVQILENDGYYVYADILLDVENYLYWYNGYTRHFDFSTMAGYYEDRNFLYQQLNGYEDHEYNIERNSDAIGYYYEPEQGIYIICDASNIDNCGYSETEPVAEDFPGRTLHKVTLNENGEVEDCVHELQTTYDENCVATLSCRTCSYRIVAYHASHGDAPITTICEQQGRVPKTTFNACTRCGRHSLTLTDGEGDSLLVLLEQATYASITMENTHRYDMISWELVGSRRDLTDCLIISDITWGTNENEPSRTFDCDIILPDLRQTVGKTILGIRFDDMTYRITNQPGLTVVFPDGMEYIGSYGSVLFSYVTELTLPEGLICLSDGALGGYAGERLVLPASLTYFPDDGFQMMNLKSLTIKGAHYEISPYLWCPELEELICEGTFDVFRGFGTACKIEEFTVPAGVQIISSYAFSRMESLKRIVLPEGVIEIERQAFEDCKNLHDVVLPDSLEKIGENAFRDCDALRHVELRGVKVIGSNAFYGCGALEEVTVSEVLTTVGRSAFAYCESLKKINLPDTASVGNDAFRGCTLLQ